MASSTKLNLSNEKFEQKSGSTLNLNGNTIVSDLRYESVPTLTGDTQLVHKKYVDDLAFSGGSTGSGFWQTSGTTNVTTPTISGSVTFVGGTYAFHGVTTMNAASAHTIGVPLNATALQVGNTNLGRYLTFAVLGQANLFSSSSVSTGVISATSPTIHTQLGTSLGIAGSLRTTGGGFFGVTSNGQSQTGFLDVVNSFTRSSGNTEYKHVYLEPTINTTGTYSGLVRGIYYNPTLTSTTGATHIALETTAGQVRVALDEDETSERIVVQDETTNKLSYRDLSSIKDIITVEVTLTAEQIRSSNTSPVTLATAPSGFAAIMIGPVYASKDFDTSAFATNTTSQVVCGAQSSGSLSSLMTHGTDAFQIVDVTCGVNINAHFGNEITFRTLGGDPTDGGDSTITLYFAYRLIKI